MMCLQPLYVQPGLTRMNSTLVARIIQEDKNTATPIFDNKSHGDVITAAFCVSILVMNHVFVDVKDENDD